ncbi:hypothetical protein BRADI_1g39042v3 [Brachypodium distachyon]|uniref:Uncharacterized protein n=1 Tax=Brachypodium distachyon TaxID=15368 RepID=A0A0Q3L4P3_BRADI|nr:hypothetical protein BRADI_1g39042v3 [Brachypodium distachyon]
MGCRFVLYPAWPTVFFRPCAPFPFSLISRARWPRGATRSYRRRAAASISLSSSRRSLPLPWIGACLAGDRAPCLDWLGGVLLSSSCGAQIDAVPSLWRGQVDLLAGHLYPSLAARRLTAQRFSPPSGSSLARLPRLHDIASSSTSDSW